MDLGTKICPDCGAFVPSDAPVGLCIACLLKAAQEDTGISGDGGLTMREGKRRQVGDYELIREIGRGGMGVVFEARQRSLNRIVAVKLILSWEFASETAVARFKEEAELIASLAHPNIVPIYEIGEDDGCHFYSMKLIEGESLAGALNRNAEADSYAAAESPQIDPNAEYTVGRGSRRAFLSLSHGKAHRELRPTRPGRSSAFAPRDSALLLAKVARAVHFAHQRGIIHRDLSPENILLDAEREPCVSDFGMARLMSAERRLTQTQTIAGKPDYMAPEQVNPQGPHATTASDIFSLGAIFYQLLTGERPFAADSSLAILELIRTSEPLPPSRLNPAVDRDLETICLKCLAKDPAGRYASAAALADDLERWLRSEPILARPVGAFERTFKWIRRNPLKAALSAVCLFAILGPLVITFYLYYFVLPLQARSHPIFGWDHTINGFRLPFERNNSGRLTMNFDLTTVLREHVALLYFTNIPSAHRGLVSELKCQIMADIPGAPDEQRSPSIWHCQKFTLSRPHSRDRAYYVASVGWNADELLLLAPDAQVCVTFLDGQK